MMSFYFMYTNDSFSEKMYHRPDVRLHFLWPILAHFKILLRHRGCIECMHDLVYPPDYSMVAQ